MRRPERTLRRDAFMAHYLQARNNFEGAITRFDDPILIKMAREGVKSTQFLYSAPFRPAFARSTMGKAMTRFQLWAWNSVSASQVGGGSPLPTPRSRRLSHRRRGGLVILSIRCCAPHEGLSGGYAMRGWRI